MFTYLLQAVCWRRPLGLVWQTHASACVVDAGLLISGRELDVRRRAPAPLMVAQLLLMLGRALHPGPRELDAGQLDVGPRVLDVGPYA